MKVSHTSTITDMIKVGKSIDLTYSKLSTHDMVGDIEFINHHLLFSYKDYISRFTVLVTLTDKEFLKYQFNPKLLAYDIYGSTDLYFVLLIVNDLMSEKEFSLRTFKLIKPDNIDLIHDIYNKEKQYLINNKYVKASEPYETYQFNAVGEVEDNKELEARIAQLEKEFEKIKNTIKDTIAGVIDENFDDLLSDRIDKELADIKNKIDQIVQNAVFDLETSITNIENQLTNINKVIEGIVDIKLKDQLDYIMDKIDNLGSNEELQKLKAEVDQLRADLDNLLSDNLKEIIDAITGDLDGFKALLNAKTRDVAFQILEPITLGLQKDTEFHIPYVGSIEKATMSVRLDSIKDSNIIVIIQRSNTMTGGWDEVGRLNLFVDLFHDEFLNLNIPINNQSIRFNIEAGHMDNIKGLAVVLSVKEVEVDPPPTQT